MSARIELDFPNDVVFVGPENYVLTLLHGASSIGNVYGWLCDSFIYKRKFVDVFLMADFEASMRAPIPSNGRNVPGCICHLYDLNHCDQTQNLIYGFVALNSNDLN